MNRTGSCSLRALVIGVGLALACASFAKAENGIGGTKPAYLVKALSAVPNEQAIVKRFWAPGLEQGYTPQGLAVSGGRVHMVGYGPGGCRIFTISTGNGALSAAMPVSACTHGGGLAWIGGVRFVLVDTRALFVIANGAVIKRIALGGNLRGSYGDFDGTDLWIGAYNKEGPGRIWRIPLGKLSQTSLTDSDASESLAIPAGAQGMAFGGGVLWMTFSGSKYGRLSRMDRKSGQVLASYEMPAGIEDIGIDSAGLIWSVSEAGAKKYQGWTTTYPLVFAIDPAKLR